MMEFDLFKEWLPSVTMKTQYLFDGSNDEQIEQKYPSFMLNRALSQYDDTVFIANEVNRFASTLDPKLQYDFLFHMIQKKKRFSKWAKGHKTDEIKLIMEVYNVSAKKAEDMQHLFDQDQIESMKEYVYKGGKDGKK